ncbi:MAG: fumarate hydratase C-terminal domain-containing protein [Victivallales bacterium]|nr:fumarate hydratase C-terminal domain-containing protein [Victivallales bacterium]
MAAKKAEIALEIPLQEKAVRELRCGQSVRLSGILYTARDAAHKYLAGPAPQLPDGLCLANGVLYHCGPVMVRENGQWRVTAAGPTTSAREEPYMAEVIRRYGIRAIVGKGGMGARTLAALREYGCVYLSAVGGAAQVLAAAVKRVNRVYFLEEFGSPEAMWELSVEEFPAIVTMDSTGGDRHAEIRNASQMAIGDC